MEKNNVLQCSPPENIIWYGISHYTQNPPSNKKLKKEMMFAIY